MTVLLQRWRAGDLAALEQVTPMVYAELRRLAAGALRGERPGLRPTELVSEAWLRFSDGAVPAVNDRHHFYAIAARMMRRIVVDHARERIAQKRGGDQAPVTLDEGLVGAERPEELVALDEALTDLAAFDERRARIVELHYFGGMSQQEVADALDVHVNTVARDLRLAVAWLKRRLRP